MDSETINSWKVGVERALKKYVLGKSGYYKGTDVKNTYRITADVNGVAVNDDALYMVQGRKNAYPVTNLTMEINALLMGTTDNVVTCVTDIRAGEMVNYKKGNEILSIVAEQDIPYCHKLALVDIPADGEVIKYDDFVNYRTESAVRSAGKMGVEGKEYVVQDGDIMHFLFNV